MDCNIKARARRQADRILSATATGFLTITDGASTVGTIVERNKSFFAFDRDGTLVGEYQTRSAAIRALPAESSS